MNNKELISTIIERLETESDPEYLKREITLNGVAEKGFIGVRKPKIRAISKEYWPKVKDRSVDDILFLCTLMLEKQIFDLRAVAFEWSYRCRKNYIPEHFDLFEYWLSTYADTWIDCDDFCTKTVGELIIKYPKLLSNLQNWTKSDNRWVRRGSAVSLIPAARKGMFKAQVFEIAELLMEDQDAMVQKGYGWLLKVESVNYCDEVYEFVTSNVNKMPRTAFRYALEKMPDELREKAMKL